MASDVSYQFISIQISYCNGIFKPQTAYRSFCHRPNLSNFDKFKKIRHNHDPRVENVIEFQYFNEYYLILDFQDHFGLKQPRNLKLGIRSA